ncbi:MAG: serine protein kinase, partial [bacterium]|nr:serine protein kinase [bacterium]
QEHKIKPKKFAQTDIDEVILGHTNEAEYRKLQSNEYMEALRDRTVKVDVPYITKMSEEVKIYQRDFNAEKIKGKHIAPHTLEMASMWAILTRLEEPKKINLTLVQKLKLYDGKLVTGFTEDNVKELRKEAVREGLDGISPRYIQDKISNALVQDRLDTCLNPFMVLNELEGGLKHHSLLKNEEQRKRFLELLSVVKDEYEEVIKSEIQRAVASDEEGIMRIGGMYLDNVKAYTTKEKVKSKYSGQLEEPDEKMMRALEEKIDIPESRKDDFRREIMSYITTLSSEGKTFPYKTNERFYRALELKLFEDRKDTLKLTSLLTSNLDQEAKKRIEGVKQQLIKNYGYCETCAGDVLNYVAGIFARGDTKGSA